MLGSGNHHHPYERGARSGSAPAGIVDQAQPGYRRLLLELRGEAGPDAPVFRSAKGGALDPSQHRIVKAAAARAGLSAAVSAHWLRHAHASHALDRGAPIIWCRPRSAIVAWPPTGWANCG